MNVTILSALGIGWFFLQEIFLVLISICLRRSQIHFTSRKIEPANFRLVVQYQNKEHHRYTLLSLVLNLKNILLHVHTLHALQHYYILDFPVGSATSQPIVFTSILKLLSPYIPLQVKY